MRLDELGELGLLAELERLGLVQGIEHDAAQIGGLVVTQDALVEGVHFRFDLVSWAELGFRAAAANISDLAASGAEPLALVVTLALPGDARVEDVVALYAGMAEAGVPVRGGDTTRAGAVMLSVTALGRSDRVPGRAGARVGDLVVVTGPLGGAGAAFRERQAHASADSRRRRTAARRRCATAMLDISDGLAVDAAHIARRSGCRLAIELERVPLVAGATIEDVGFGEDYELLAATPDALGFPVIGRCEAGEGVAVDAATASRSSCPAGSTSAKASRRTRARNARAAARR